MVCDKTDLIDWLFKRLKTKAFDANKAYSSEVAATSLEWPLHLLS